MPSAETQAAVEVEVRIDAAPETVFDFFTDPDKMVQWMGLGHELDPRPGGAFRCDINGRDVASGSYLEVDRPRRVVFTWGWESAESRTGAGAAPDAASTTEPGSSTVEVSLVPDGEGTLVTVVHRDLASEESRAAHRHGWEHYVERLRLAGSGVDAGPDPWAAEGIAETEVRR